MIMSVAAVTPMTSIYKLRSWLALAGTIQKLLNVQRLSELSKCSHKTWSQWSFLHTSTASNARQKRVPPMSDLYTNPVDRLQPFLQVPVIRDEDQSFKPSQEEMEAAAKLFEQQNIKGHDEIKFVGSWPNPHIMPAWDVPEIAFIGKSNVGKSSLLDAMFAKAPDVKVKVSKKPGHTKLMNVFNVANRFHLVDMPGYGFNMPDHFETSVEAYLKSRRSLVRVFMLIDGSEGPDPVDSTGIEMMEEMSVPYVILDSEMKRLNSTWGSLTKIAYDRQKWRSFVAALSASGHNGIMNFILFDGSVGMTRNDKKYFCKYSQLNLPLSTVLTKIDLAQQGVLLRNVVSTLKFRDESKAHSCFPQPFLVSSITGEGLAYLQSFIGYITGNLKIKAIS